MDIRLMFHSIRSHYLSPASLLVREAPFRRLGSIPSIPTKLEIVARMKNVCLILFPLTPSPAK